jgi:DNA-binding CsgD family transcriptional regulator
VSSETPVADLADPGDPGGSDLQALVDRSPVGTLVFKLPERHVLIANEAVVRLIGDPRPAIVGSEWDQLWDAPDTSRAGMAFSALAAGALYSFRARLRLRTRRGPVAASVWARRMLAQGRCVAAVMIDPSTDGVWSPPPVESVFATGALGSDADRIALLEQHLLQFAAELHGASWSRVQPVAADLSRFAALDGLPRRQRAIVDRLLRGERISSIAAAMYVAPSTVRNHLSHVFAAFGVHSQAELLALLRGSVDGTGEDPASPPGRPPRGAPGPR